MAKHATVENCQAFAVLDLHRAGGLREQLVSFPWCSFKWPGLVRVTANRWRVSDERRVDSRSQAPSS